MFVFFCFYLNHAHGYHQDNLRGRALVYMTFLTNKHIYQDSCFSMLGLLFLAQQILFERDDSRLVHEMAID